MPTESPSPVSQTDLEPEIAHLLLIDIVGYSKLLVNEQIEAVQELNRVVRGTECFRKAEADGKLLRVPTGDGMILLFSNSPEQPIRCALEIAEQLKERPQVQVRMGIHSGPANQVRDVNDQVNVVGAGINIAQRVMDCGDAGHILLSKHIADDLVHYRHWQPYLRDLGEYEVKHGLRIGIVSLCKDSLGNPALPEKLQRRKRRRQTAATIVKPVRSRWSIVAKALVFGAIAIALAVSIYFGYDRFKRSRSGAAAAPEKTIAVLPFENLSADQENAFFADGVQDEILTDLAKIADLKVISRTSVMQYRTVAKRNLREIAHQLGVAHVVEGSVQRAENRMRISAQLIDARSDTHLWAEHYDRPLGDVFGIQSEIAKAVADQLKARLLPSEKAAIEKPTTADLAAYELYLQAKALFANTTDSFRSNQKLPQAMRLLNEAVARDPQFLLAWCLLSKAHIDYYWYGYDHTSGRLNLVNEAAQTALRLQPDSGEAHLALAKYYYRGFRDYDRALSELAVARRTLPNDAEVAAYMGYIGQRQGHWAEATRNLERSLELDPRNLDTAQQMATSYTLQRRYTDAIRTYDRALTIEPADPANLRILRAHVVIQWRADIKPLRAAWATMLSEDPSVGPDIDAAWPDFALCERSETAAARLLVNYPRGGGWYFSTNCPHAYWEAVVARWQGDSARAQAAFTAARSQVEKIVEEQPDFAAPLSLLAIIDAGLGRKDEAVREGRRACELLPISKDAIDGSAFVINLAQIYAWIGQKDLAIEQIAEIERTPNRLSYGFLKLHPYWDFLRGDPRFEKIVTSLAPKS